MKKTYEAPTVERVEFKYRDQVVAASNGKCGNKYVNTGDDYCPKDEQVLVEVMN